MTIYISRTVNGYLRISNSYGRSVMYIDYTKREALSRFKLCCGVKYKRGVVVVDLTKEQ